MTLACYSSCSLLVGSPGSPGFVLGSVFKLATPRGISLGRLAGGLKQIYRERVYIRLLR